MTYKVCKLVNLPSSGGTGPENWFASRLLIKYSQREFIKIKIKRPNSYSFLKMLVLVLNEMPKFRTYRYVRVVIFTNAFGISPDKRLTRTELQKILFHL